MTHPTIHINDVIRTVTEHPRRVVLPVVLVALVALVYACTRPTMWEASQALVVRDEAGDRANRPGKFSQPDEMKTTQETILELAKSRRVLSKALREVGAPADFDSEKTWPTEAALTALQSRVKVTPPKGAEFGKTEVFYLKVQDTDPKRATELASAICHQLQERVASLRESTAGSTVEELTRSRAVAEADLAEATKKLTETEQKAGSDLAELRILTESPSGDSDLRRNAVELEKEIRAYRASQSENAEFLKVLEEAKTDPTRLLASPSILTKSQPALGRLKDGLVDAQLRSSQAQGTMSDEHPLVKGALESERAIREQLHNEISLAIEGVQVDMRVNADRIKTLEGQKQALNERMSRLAAIRADYGNQVAAAKHRTETLKSVEHDLSEARASQAAARVSSRISTVDTPDLGAGPVGLSRAMIFILGLFGGLLASAAVVFLSVKPSDHSTQVRTRLDAAPRTPQAAPLTLKQAIERVTAGQS